MMVSLGWVCTNDSIDYKKVWGCSHSTLGLNFRMHLMDVSTLVSLVIPLLPNFFCTYK